MRVAVIPGDETGCGTYRMILPADAVQKVRPDWSVELYQPGSVKVGADETGRAVGLQGIKDPHTLDVVVMQRIGSEVSLGFTDWCRNHGIATVVDADDAMWCIDRDNKAYRFWNSQKWNWKYLDTSAERADLVTVTTKHLAQRYGKHGRVEVIPNYIPSEVFTYDQPEKHDSVVIGWSGFVATHPHDLKVVGDAMHRVVEDTGAIARIVGDAGGAAKAWGLQSIEGVPPQPLGPAYFTALSTFDIGVVPLADTHFNRAKSWLKALEFSAMGLPVVASPTPDNLRLSKKVPIYLAKTPDEWYENLRWLVDHPYLREERGVEARTAVREHFTVESAGEQWAQAWERAYNRRKRMVA